MIERRRASAHVFVTDLESPLLEPDDEHHVVRVLRVRPGEIVTVSDGRGSWRVCTMGDKGSLVPSDDVVHREQTRARPVTVVFGVTKSDKPEAVVQKLTELGVDHIVPVVLDHSVVRWDDDKIDRQHERFIKVAREAAMQSRQVDLPTVHRVEPNLDSALRSLESGGQWGRIVLAEPGGIDSFDGVSAVIIGPEGGFSARERDLVTTTVELPGGILRAETAAVAAGALLVQALGRR